MRQSLSPLIPPRGQRILALLGVTVLLAIFAQTVSAQTTTAGVEGIVTDLAGTPQEEVSVVVVNTQTGLTRVVTTDAKGYYIAPGLPPALYVVEFHKEGLFAMPVEIELNIGRTSNVDMSMSLQEFEVVTVTSERPILNVTESEVSTVVNQDQIIDLPLINRDFTDLASLAPGAKPKQTGQIDPTKNEDIYRPFTIGAANGRQVNIQIDGGDSNDRAVGTWTQGYSAEAIQEFEIITDQYRAEYGRASHGVVNVITKSGTNEFSGSAFGLYRDDSLRSENFSERLSGAEKTPSERKQYGASFGGPILHDKVFFFGAYERVEEDSPTAYSPDLTGYARTAAFAGNSFTTGLERDLYTLKFNWNVDDSSTVFVRYAGDENTFSNDQGGALTLDIFNGNSTNEGWSILGNWTGIFGEFLSEAYVHINDFENGIVSNTPLDSSITPDAGAQDFDFITTQFYDLFTLGRNLNTPQATLQALEQYRYDLTWLKGNHDWKVGFDVIQVDFDDSLLGALIPTVNIGFQTGITPDDVDADPDSLAIIDEISFNNPGLIPGTDYTQMGFYLQDTFRVTDDLTVYFGLRYDSDEGVFDSLREGINRELYEGIAANEPTRFDNVFPDDPAHFAPRFGFVYQLTDDDVVRASFGVFHDKIVENLTLFGTQNLSPVVFPILPNLDCDTGQCVAGSDPDGPGVGVEPIPVDFTWANWLSQGALRGWYEDLVSILGPLTTLSGQSFFVPSPDWDTPYLRTYSVGWGHRFNTSWSLDTNAIFSEGGRQLRIWDIRGRNSGVETATDAGREYMFTTDGRTEYMALQTQVRGRTSKLDLTFNLTLSQARGTQDTGASAGESGTLDIFTGGNRRYTGPDPADNPLCGTPGGPTCSTEESEFGPISGDQVIWTSIFAAYRLPYAITVSGDMSYGSDIAFWPSAGYDWNNDGFNSGSEYLGNAGSGDGDDYFAVNLRVAKAFTWKDHFEFDVFAEVFNLTNHTNWGLFVDQIQTTGRTGQALPQQNPNFLRPTGNEVGQSRTWNVGLRFRI